MDMDKTAIGVIEIDDSTQMISAPASEATQMAMNVDCPVCRTPNPPSETYCIDCGFLLSSEPIGVAVDAEQPDYGKLVTTDGAREFMLHIGENSVGRENVDILLSHNTVSRSHATVTVDNSGAFVTDNGSTNGTSVDGQKVAAGERFELKDGSEVMFGSFVLKYDAPATQPSDSEEQEEQYAPSEAAFELEEEAEESPAPVARIISKDGVLSFDIHDGVNTIGRREADNAIRIPDPYCSGRHADIEHVDGVFTITDIGSTNGTAVNGERLEIDSPCDLHDGDEITFGQTTFRFEVA